MKKTKLHFGLLTAVLSLFIWGLFGCQEQESNKASVENANEFFSSLQEAWQGALNSPLRTGTRSFNNGTDSTSWVYFDKNIDDDPLDPESSNPGGDGGGGGGDTGGDNSRPLPQTTTELLEMAWRFDTDLSGKQDGYYPDSLAVSDNDARQALAEMTSVARNYFIAKGVSDVEITEALAECGVDETFLIPTAVELAAYDANQPGMPDLTTQLLKCLAFPAYAESQWAKALRCAFDVLGGDIIHELAYAGGKLSKKLLKKGIIKVASRYVGPIGVLLVMYDFSGCMS